jgi:dihydropyrimidinase
MVLPFAMQQKGESLREVVKQYHAKADGHCYVDVSFHLIIADATDRVLGQELPALVNDGYTSFKVFMTYEGLALSDLEMLNVMSVARETGALVMVHAENYDAIRFLTDRLERAGQDRAALPRRLAADPGRARGDAPRHLTVEIVDVPIMIVHVSNREAMEEIRRAQQRGLKIYGETCPQYLVLTEKDLEGPQHGGRQIRLLAAAARSCRARSPCWEGLQQGVFSLFSSDHCPFRYDDPHGKLDAEGPHLVPLGAERHSRRRDAAADPVLGGRRQGPHHAQPVRRAVATNHAKTYGLYPKKGTIAVGSDADIAIWDPAREVDHLAKPDARGLRLHAYDGIAVKGWPISTMVRGQFVVRDGALVGKEGAGAYVAREKSPIGEAAGRLNYGAAFAVACSIRSASLSADRSASADSPLITRSTGTTCSTAPTVA